MTIRYMWPSMSGPIFTEQLPSLRALHIHPTQTHRSQPTLYGTVANDGSDTSVPYPPRVSEASHSSADDAEAFPTPMSTFMTPSPSPRTIATMQHTSLNVRKRRSPSSSESVDSHYDDERTKFQCLNDTQGIKSKKKAAKERAHRDGEAFYRQTLEDVVVLFTGYRPSAKLAKGNKTSSGLTYPKALMAWAFIRMGTVLLDESYKQAVKEGRVAEWQAKWQQHIEDHVGDDDHLLEGTLLDIPNQPRCCHANSKEQTCLTHGHKDWTECRRGRFRTAFQDKVRAYQESVTADRESVDMY